MQLLTRSGLDWTARMKTVAEEVGRLPIDDVTLDGEVVVLNESGTTNFADLQAAMQEGRRNPLTYFCFDLLHVGGRNPRDLPLIERKELLEELLKGANAACAAGERAPDDEWRGDVQEGLRAACGGDRQQAGGWDVLRGAECGVAEVEVPA